MNHKKHKTSLFIFRQDLRVHDNTGLMKAISESENIVPIFIFDKNILESFPKDSNVVNFLFNAVEQLNNDLSKKGSYLGVYHGDPKEIIPQLIEENNIEAIYRNESYGYNAVTRDVWIQSRCKEHNIVYYPTHDFLLVPIDTVPTRKVFTPFFKLWQKYIEAHPITIEKDIVSITSPTIKKEKLSTIKGDLGIGNNNIWPIHFWKDRLDNFDFARYNETRNTPSIDGSSKLSPYTRFGIVSIREVYAKAKDLGAETYISELAWREFRQHIYYHFPETRNIEFQEKRRHIKRDNNKEYFEARKNGMTGYPLVDAGMRQLKATNRIHNRVRMVVASFLTKDLLIDRRWGEKHFADYLIDYDANVNIGNRQRSASVGADPKPLRIFSPMLQSEKFDPECVYIKKRIPELQDYSSKEIHDPLNNNLGYAMPIVNHYEWSKKAKERYMEYGKDILD